MKSIALAGVLATAMTGSALAQDGQARPLSFGIGYTLYDIEDTDFDAISLRAGYDFNRWLGVEAEGLFGMGDETVDVLGVDVDASLNYSLGIFGKATLPLSDRASLFARLGFATAELEASALGVSETESEEAIAIGAGGEFAISGPHHVRAEYTRYEFDDSDADSFSISYVARF